MIKSIIKYILSMHEGYEHNTELNLEQLRVGFEGIFLTALIQSSFQIAVLMKRSYMHWFVWQVLLNKYALSSNQFGYTKVEEYLRVNTNSGFNDISVLQILWWWVL